MTTNIQTTGPVTIISQTWADWLSQEIRLWANQSFVEIEFSVGPVPIDDGLGKVCIRVLLLSLTCNLLRRSQEIITRYTSTSITNEGYLYTDSNGREMQGSDGLVTPLLT